MVIKSYNPIDIEYMDIMSPIYVASIILLIGQYVPPVGGERMVYRYISQLEETFYQGR